MNGLTRGSAAIVGAAESDIGAVAANMSPLDLMAQGIHRALADCGLKLRDVDGIFCAATQARTSAMSMCEYLRLPSAYTDSTIVGGSSFEVHVAHAQAALAAGLCSVAARSVLSVAAKRRRANTIPMKHHSDRFCHRQRTPSPHRVTCMNSAPRGSSWPRWLLLPGNGRC